MASKFSVTFILLVSTVFSFRLTSTQSNQGQWKVLKRSIGISAMHMALLPNDKIIVFDRTNSGPSNISLPQSKCSKIAAPVKSAPSGSSPGRGGCSAHSVEFDASTRAIRPLTIVTDTWCSSGSLSHDGVLIQTGGFEAGERVVRFIEPCSGCDWVEVADGLVSSRWYASNQVLPDGRIVIVGGRLEFSYEFIPKSSDSDRRLYRLLFLEETRYSAKVPNNLYPFLHLVPDGNLFVFANDRAILLDYLKNRVVRTFPPMPAENGVSISRNYPSTGSSALLPITLSENGTSFSDIVVLVCGGTPSESNIKASEGEFIPAAKSCGRIVVTADEPRWEMEIMPVERAMGDMIMLPTGDILIINGARRGTAGWNAAREPVLNPVLYRTGARYRKRFELMSPTMIPRLYHSTAHLLSDGRVLVGGSNPNRNYNFSTIFPTELSLEAFYPPYFSSPSRPAITSVHPGVELGYKEKISVRFRSNHEMKNGGDDTETIQVTMVAPSFTTHSFAMNQRLMVLDIGEAKKSKSGSDSDYDYAVEGYTPGTPELAPPGYYLLFVVVDGVPSRGVWVRIK